MENGKKFKPDHNQNTIYAAIGQTEKEFDEIIEKAIDAFNGQKESKSAGLEASVIAVRGAVFDDYADASQYELILANTLFEMGIKQFKSKLNRLITAILDSPMFGMLPDELKMMLLIKGIESLMNEGHECTECGKCGKTFGDEEKSGD